MPPTDQAGSVQHSQSPIAAGCGAMINTVYMSATGHRRSILLTLFAYLSKVDHVPMHAAGIVG
jgi:hypothetical protein